MGATRKLIDHITVQGWMLRNLDLTTKNEVIVYATIFSFSRDGVSEYRGGRKYLAQSLDIPLSTLDKVIDKLIDAGLVIKENYVVRNVTYSNYKVDIEKVIQFLPKDEYIDSEGCTQNDNTPTQNDNTPTQNDNQVYKYINNKVNGIPFTPAEPDKSKISHTRDFRKHTNTVIDELNSLGEIEESRPKKKSLYEKCVDEIANPIYGFSSEVQQRLKDFLPTTLQANKYPVNGINQWKYRLKSLVEISKSPNKQIEIIEYSISHSITGFVSPNKNRQQLETKQDTIKIRDLDEAKRAMKEKEERGVEIF